MTSDILFAKFETIFNAPNAVMRIRDLILRLAVRGKLVERRIDECYASQDLRTIWLSQSTERIEKTDERISAPFKVPDHWEWVSLQEIASFKIGKTPPRKNTDFWDKEDHEWVSIADMQHYQPIDSTKESISSLAAKEVFRNDPAPAGSILMSFKLTIGKVARTLLPRFHNEAIISLSPPEPELDDYLFRTLPLFAPLQISNNAIKGKTLNKGLLKSLPIAFPPLAEQKRIVAKVDELMALCDQLEAQQQERDKQHAALARASLARFANDPTPDNLQFLFHRSYDIDPEDLRKTVLNLAIQGRLVSQDSRDEPAVDLYSHINRVKESLIKQSRIKKTKVEANPKEDDAGPLPSGWFWTRLGNCFDVRDGTHDTPKYVNKGYPLITSKNIYSGYLDFDNVRFISETDHRQISERSRVDRGDVLFAMIGSIGNPAIVDTDRKFSIKNVALFKYYDDISFEPRFLHLYLSHVADEMKEKAMGGVQSFVSLGFLRNYVFPLPPLAEQKRIVAKVDELMALVDELETQLASSREVAKNLLEALVAELTAA